MLGYKAPPGIQDQVLKVLNSTSLNDIEQAIVLDRGHFKREKNQDLMKEVGK